MLKKMIAFFSILASTAALAETRIVALDSDSVADFSAEPRDCTAIWKGSYYQARASVRLPVTLKSGEVYRLSETAYGQHGTWESSACEEANDRLDDMTGGLVLALEGIRSGRISLIGNETNGYRCVRPYVVIQVDASQKVIHWQVSSEVVACPK